MEHRGRKPSRASACEGKIKYTEVSAKKEARHRSARTMGNYRAYPCPYRCRLPDKTQAWHVGHALPNKR